MKIVSTGATLSSAEYREKKKKERQKKIVLWSCGLLIILTILVGVSRFETFLIDNITVSGAQVITEEEVKANVLETLSGHWLWFVPKANAAIYPRTAVRGNLERAFPRFSSISLSLEGSKSLRVDVLERKPFALYCPSAERPEDASSCFFLDEEGFIFDEAPAFSGLVYFVYSKNPAIEEAKGSQYLSAKEFKPLSVFINELSNLGFDPIAAEVSEREVMALLSTKGRIAWNRSDDLATIYSNLESFMLSEEIRKQADFIKKVGTLDLRTRNKVFYRFHE